MTAPALQAPGVTRDAAPMTRIIGGQRGAADRRAARRSTRPTSDRVREALFSAIESWCGSLQGLRFLDLYAGSGAVGLEAWSRGAGVVTLVEQDRRTAALIAGERQGARLRQGRRGRRRRSPRRCAAARGAVRRGVPRPAVPARRGRRSTPTCAALVDHGWLVPGAMVVVERSARSPEPAWPDGLDGRRASKRTARPCFGTVTPRPPPRTRTRRSPVRRAVCPGSFDPVTNGHLDIVAPGLAALRRGGRRRRRQQVQEPAVHRRGAHRDARAGVRRASPTSASRLHRPAHRLLPGARHPRDRQGAARGHRLRLRAPDGADERLLAGVETVFVPDQPASARSSPRAWSRRSRRSAATSPGWCPTSCYEPARRSGCARERHVTGGRALSGRVLAGPRPPVRFSTGSVVPGYRK